VIVSVPSPPVLLPGLTGAPVAEVEELRAACRKAIGALLATDPVQLTVVGADRPDWGGRPLAVAVAEALIGPERRVRQCLVTPEASPGECQELGAALTGALLVVADGSARRGLKAPGYLDERAAPFDAGLLAALQSGDPAQLLALDAGLAAELMVAGRAPWQVMAGAAQGRRWITETHYVGDPFGVFYPVLTWR